MLKKNSTIFLAGHKGMVGSAILRKLKLFGYTNIIVENKKNLNLLDQKKVHNFINRIKPKVVIIAAARVGGIFINSRNKANFIYQNLTIQII